MLVGSYVRRTVIEKLEKAAQTVEEIEGLGEQKIPWTDLLYRSGEN